MCKYYFVKKVQSLTVSKEKLHKNTFVQKKLLENVGEIDTCCQFHQHFLHAYFVQKFVQSQNLNRPPKQCSYKKIVRIILMKLTPGGGIPRRQPGGHRGVCSWRRCSWWMWFPSSLCTKMFSNYIKKCGKLALLNQNVVFLSMTFICKQMLIFFRKTFKFHFFCQAMAFDNWTERRYMNKCFTTTVHSRVPQ